MATRYHNHTLSWVVTGYFVIFVVLAVIGAAATVVSLWKRNSPLLVKLAVAPVVLLALGFTLGALKAVGSARRNEHPWQKADAPAVISPVPVQAQRRPIH